jgi:hypothetical protein
MIYFKYIIYFSPLGTPRQRRGALKIGLGRRAGKARVVTLDCCLTVIRGEGLSWR